MLTGASAGHNGRRRCASARAPNKRELRLDRGLTGFPGKPDRPMRRRWKLLPVPQGPVMRQVPVLADPIAAGQMQEQCPVETPWLAEVDVLSRGGLPQPGGRVRAPRTAFSPAWNVTSWSTSRPEPFGVFEGAAFGIGREIAEPFAMHVKAQFAQAIQCWVVQQMFSSVEVAGAADVFVQQRRTVRGLRWRRLVEPVFEDRSDTGVSQNADFDGATADRLRPRRVKAAEQPQHPKTGAKPLFRMRPARQYAMISASVSGPMSRAWRANRSADHSP